MVIGEKYLELKRSLKVNDIVDMTGISTPTVKNILAGRSASKGYVERVQRCIDESVLKFQNQ